MTSNDPPSEPTLVGALPRGTRLHEYVFERVLGHGGFGITYLAHDTHLDKRVAIKEYLPNDLAARAPDSTVTVRAPETREAFQWGLQSFIKEARVLAKFSHPSLIQVHRYFEANDTAYFVMDYAQGVTLSTVLRQEGELPEARLRDILLPILDGLQEVHRLGVLHRDIKPDNIILRDGTAPVLIDFGAARQTLSSMTRSVLSVLTAGYAPIEQYATSGNQGPWTDLYALGAVAYRALSGKKPVDAVNRIRDDPMVPAKTLGRGRYADHFLAAIDWALEVNPEDRPADVGEFKRALAGEMAPPERAAGVAPAAPSMARIWPPPQTGDDDAPTTISGTRRARRQPWGLGAGIGLLVVALVAGSVLLLRPPAPERAAPAVPAEPESAASRSEAGQPAPPSAPAASDTTSPTPARGPRTEAQRPEPDARPLPRQAQAEAANGAPPATTTPDAAEAAARAQPETDAQSREAAAPAQAAPKAEAPAATPTPAPIAGMARGQVFQDCPDCPRMVVLPPGAFQMGAAPGDVGNRWEGPQHPVRLAQPFAIGRHEVTVGEWRACVEAGACAAAKAGPATGDPARAPVVNVSWDDALAYAAWLGKVSGRTYRLPTEAEWEYAIRAGTTTARFWGGDRTEQCAYGNGADQSALTRDRQLPAVECDDRYPVLAPVGSFKPNAFGLFDMAGNAWEWTQDCWHDTYQGAPVDGGAVESAGCKRRVIRGGSWRARANSLRSFGRGNSPPDTRSEDLGLRVVVE